jgi:hypothetical protein
MSSNDEPMFFDSIEEAQAYQKRVHDQRLMSMEAFSTAWRGMLGIELSIDQLETLGSVLAVISNSDDPCALANYYEGQVTAVLFMRRPKAEPTMAVLLGPHVFRQNELDRDNPYCQVCSLPAANQVHLS